MPVFITIVVIVIVIAVAVTLVRSMLQGGDSSDNKSDQSQEQTLQSVVVSQEATRSVRWTVRGPIVADEKFKSYQIVVTPTTRTFTVYNGYLDKVESQKTTTTTRRRTNSSPMRWTKPISARFAAKRTTRIFAACVRPRESSINSRP